MQESGDCSTQTMHNFCTLFDSNYLTRGLALYHSLRANCDSFRLYVYCFDEATYEILLKLALPDLVPIPLAGFENRELLAVKPRRSRGEYCWTCTSHIILHTLEQFGLDCVTYLDADLFFFADPTVLLDEFVQSGGSVLITEHRYTPRYDQSASSGIYCVQFISFKADERGLKVLRWWRDRCTEWCYNRHEDGKFGDQKYLDDWTERFEGVHVLQHLGGGVAPWNVQQYKVQEGPAVNGTPVVFYHFHDMSWYEDDSFMLNRYRLSGAVINFIYRPYICALRNRLAEVQRLFPGFQKGKTPPPTRQKSLWSSIEHKLKGKFHVIR